jgi:MmyB-like transcription regulator ligand binding domain
LFSPVFAASARPANTTRFVFLDQSATEFFRDYDKVANDTVALLRAEAGRDPYDRELSDLIGQLSTHSEDFRRRWAAHNVRIHTSGVKLIHHPGVGDLDLSFEFFPMPGDSSQSLLTYTSEPGSPTQDALNLLASWAATADNLRRPRSASDAKHRVPSPKTE